MEASDRFMSIRVTWEEDGQAAEVFELTDDLLHSLEQFRLSQTAPAITADGRRAVQPRDASIRHMIVRIFQECLVDHALSMFPPPQVAAAQEQARLAQQMAEQAKQTVVVSSLTPVTPAEPPEES